MTDLETLNSYQKADYVGAILRLIEETAASVQDGMNAQVLPTPHQLDLIGAIWCAASLATMLQSEVLDELCNVAAKEAGTRS